MKLKNKKTGKTMGLKKSKPKKKQKEIRVNVRRLS